MSRVRDEEYPRSYSERCERQKFMVCNVCGESKYRFQMNIHHINGDRSDEPLDNLLPLCTSCHCRVHRTPDPSRPVKRLQEKLIDGLPHTDHYNGWKRVNLPDDVYETAIEIRDEREEPLGDVIRKMCREGGYDV